MGRRKNERSPELECSAVIDAATFSSTYNAFWNEATPTVEHFVRRINIKHLERFYVPMKPEGSGRKAVIAEFAFSLFVEHVRSEVEPKDRSKQRVDAWAETERRLRPFLGQGIDLTTSLSPIENVEVTELERRLIGFFKRDRIPTRTRPLFLGCGFVDASEGDILTSSTLFEVKTVERSFRSSDIRQLLTYAALNFAAQGSEIPGVGIFNPRRGVAFEFPLRELCNEISGRSVEDLFSLIIQVFSSGELSR